MEYFKRYTGTESVSIVNALAEMGENSSYANRKLIAAANGIADYSGTATQNLMMLSLLKDGKLIKPGTDAPAQPKNTAEPTKRGFGRKVLIGALVLGAGIAAYKMFGTDEPKTATKKSGKKKATKKKSRKGLKGTDDEDFELSSVDGEDGCVTPLYPDANLNSDYDRALKWLKKQLKPDGLKVDEFWINEADECWKFTAKRVGTEKTKYRVGDIVEANFTNQLGKFQYPCIIIKKRKMFGEQYYEVHEIAMNKYPFEVGDKNGAFVVDWRIDTLREVSLRPIANDKKADIRKLLKKK